MIIGALAALLILPATSQAATPAFVTHDPSTGVQYSGTDSADNVTFTTSGGKLVVDTTAPLTAFRACTLVAGDNTKATCPLPTVINASAGGGRDKVVNNTNIAMRAFGGADNDSLTGGPARDELNGQDGDDNINGRLGDDLLSGGAGFRDLVAYSERTVGVKVNLNGVTSDNGAPGERDTLFADFESAGGGTGGDLLRGSGAANELIGGFGDDTLIGFTGSDILVGGSGSDFLISNQPFPGPRADGAVDIVTGSGGAGMDSCLFSTADFDQPSGCEFAV
jgi:Ca2+-binding RTX toxin-like protein